MSYIWTFAPENRALLQQCLNAAAPPDESNKWVQRFGPRNLDLLNKTSETITVNDSPEIDESPTVQENQDEIISNAVEEFLDPEIDIQAKFGYLSEECRKSPNFLFKLAATLSTNTTQKLFQHILASDNIKKDFLELFYKNFVPNYIKREQSRMCTDILLQSYEKYPQYCKISLKSILKDLETQNNVINNFILNLNAEKQTEFLNTISDFEFNSKEFSHNLFNIHTAYKTCDKTDAIQNYIFSCLKSFADFCSSDKNYGKLMLVFLQHENNLKRDVDGIMEELIERHKSPFKRPCLSVFMEIKEKKCL